MADALKATEIWLWLSMACSCHLLVWKDRELAFLCQLLYKNNVTYVLMKTMYSFLSNHNTSILEQNLSVASADMQCIQFNWSLPVCWRKVQVEGRILCQKAKNIHWMKSWSEAVLCLNRTSRLLSYSMSVTGLVWIWLACVFIIESSWGVNLLASTQLWLRSVCWMFS